MARMADLMVLPECAHPHDDVPDDDADDGNSDPESRERREFEAVRCGRVDGDTLHKI